MQKKKASQNFQGKPRKEVKKRRKIRAGDIINLTYNEVRISFIGRHELELWNTFSRKERRKHAENVASHIRNKIFKPIEVDIEFMGKPMTKMIYVPYAYKGSGEELVDTTDYSKDEN